MWVERRGVLTGRGSLCILMDAESKTVNIQILYMGVERNSAGREVFVVPTEPPIQYRLNKRSPTDPFPNVQYRYRDLKMNF